MAYEIQQERFRSGDMLDNRKVGIDITRAAEQASALDAENLPASMLANVTVAQEALHSFSLVQVESDPNFGSLGSYNDPDTSATNIFVVEPTCSWQVVASTTITTGESTLRIVAFAQWLQDIFSGGADDATATPTGIQLGVRVDGQEIFYAGSADTGTVPFWPVRASAQRDATHMTPGPQTPTDKMHSAGLGPAVDHARWVAVTGVGPGSHLIELVARVVTQHLGDINTHAVYIYDRSLCVMERPLYPANVTAADGVSIASIPAETTVSATELRTNRLTPVVNKLNAVTDGMLKVGAVQAAQAPNVLLDAATNYIINASATNANAYPGYSSVTMAANNTANGWRKVNDGTDFLSTEGTHGDFATTNTPCLIEIYATLGLANVGNAAAVSPHDRTAAFILGYRLNGESTLRQVPATHAFVSNYALHNSLLARGATDLNTRVTIQGWLDLRTSTIAKDIDWFALFVSSLQIGSSDTPIVAPRRGHINVIVYRY